MVEATMRKMAGVCLVSAIVAAAIIWANAPSFTKQLKATTALAEGISVLELEQQVDVKGLPVLDVPDTI
jgi:hypothetical protein